MRVYSGQAVLGDSLLNSESQSQTTDVSSITRQGWSFWMKVTTTSLQVIDS